MNKSEQAPLISVAAPAYNEAESIEKVIRGWVRSLDNLGVAWEIVVANDGSRDQTGPILAALSGEISGLKVVGGEENHGYGHAMGLAIASCTGQYVATIDSDGQFDLDDLAQYLPLVEKGGYDGVNGRRMKKKDTPLRVLADRCLNLIVRILFGTRLSDTNCALKLVRADVLQALNLEASGYPFPTEVVLRLEAGGARLAEKGARHYERAGGMSSLKVWRTGWQMLWFLVYLRLRLALGRAGVIQSI